MTEKAAKTKAAAKPKKPRTAPSHPRVADMVDAAIKALKDRSGSSLQAIKKYIATTYKVDADKLSPFIRKYIKSAVASGGLVQTKGKGASGSFRIGGSGGSVAKSTSPKKSAAKPKKAAKASTSPKKAAAAKPKKSKPKKAASPAKKSKPVAKAATKKVKTTAAKKKPAKSSPKKKAAPKKAKK